MAAGGLGKRRRTGLFFSPKEPHASLRWLPKVATSKLAARNQPLHILDHEFHNSSVRLGSDDVRSDGIASLRLHGFVRHEAEDAHHSGAAVVELDSALLVPARWKWMSRIKLGKGRKQIKKK